MSKGLRNNVEKNSRILKIRTRSLFSLLVVDSLNSAGGTGVVRRGQALAVSL